MWLGLKLLTRLSETDRGQVIKGLTSLAVEVELYRKDFDHEPKGKILGEKRWAGQG